MNENLSIGKTCLVIMTVLFLAGCTNASQIFAKNSSDFRFSNACMSFVDDNNIGGDIEGSVWYAEDYTLHEGRLGLHWRGNDEWNAGTLPVNAISMYVSPDGKEAVFRGYEEGADILNSRIYHIMEKNYQVADMERLGESPVWTEDGKIMGTTSDFHESRISVITTELETGIVSRYDHFDGGMSSEPMPKIARNGILAYLWYSNFEGPRLVVYDTRNEREIARYKDINYEIRPSWYGFLLNPEGTRILSISTPLGDEYDGRQQELFGVEIGRDPVQITNFHEKYPYFMIYDLNSGGRRWSPDNRWIVIKTIPSETGVVDDMTAAKYLFLVDLEHKVAYAFCEPLGGNEHLAWSPDSRFFALSLDDKLWVVNPKTRKSRLLVERSGVPLQVLGWTIP